MTHSADMKTIGMIGGMSWLSTREYYSCINAYVARKLGALYSAPMIISSLNFQFIQGFQQNGRWEEAGQCILAEAQKLERAGADLIIVCSVTGNECIQRIRSGIRIPVLDIAHALAEDILNSGIRSVALLGTRYTMEMDFIRDPLCREYGLRVVTPSGKERARIHAIIYDELCKGHFHDASRAELGTIIDGLAQRQRVEGIILGCTELPLLVEPRDHGLPLFNSTRIHARHAARLAIQGLVIQRAGER